MSDLPATPDATADGRTIPPNAAPTEAPTDEPSVKPMGETMAADCDATKHGVPSVPKPRGQAVAKNDARLKTVVSESAALASLYAATAPVAPDEPAPSADRPPAGEWEAIRESWRGFQRMLDQCPSAVDVPAVVDAVERRVLERRRNHRSAAARRSVRYWPVLPAVAAAAVGFALLVDRETAPVPEPAVPKVADVAPPVSPTDPEPAADGPALAWREAIDDEFDAVGRRLEALTDDVYGDLL
ncbi:MAG: hypothetical protein ACRC1K_04085 [Planctomycetia bacterium]